MTQREFQWFDGAIEADQADPAGQTAGGAEDGQGIGGGAEANVPDDEFTRVLREAFVEAELPDVNGLGFGDGSDDRMKRLAFGDGMNAMGPIGESDDVEWR